MNPQRVRRKPRPPVPTNTLTIRYGLGSYAVVLAVAVAVAAGLTSTELRLGIGVLLVDAAMLATLIRARRTITPYSLGLREFAPAKSVWLVVLAFIVYVIINVISDGAGPHQAVTAVLATRHESVTAKVVGALALVVCAPVVEEIFFRGFLYRTLRREMGIGRAAIVAGFLFGIAHATTYPLNTLPPKIAFGVIACLLYEYTGSLYPCIVLHGFVDGTAFELAVGGSDGIALCTFLVVGLGVLLYSGVRRVGVL